MLFSLIIPAYNAQKYIFDCLESCMAQRDFSIENFEIIVVDDGSTDLTAIIVEEILRNFPNHKILKKSNGGLSSARNYGLKHARGTYVWFIDSDDWIRLDSLSNLKEIVEVYRPDICMFNCTDIFPDGKVKVRFSYKEPNKMVSGQTAILRQDWKACAPFNIYRRNFLENNDLKFYEGIFHEDNEFTPRAMLLASCIYQLNEDFYYVRHTPGSITRSPNPKRAFDIIKVVRSLDDFINTHNYPQEVKTCISCYIVMCLNSALALASKFNKVTKNRFNSEFRLFFKERGTSHFINSRDKRYLLEYIMLLLVPNSVYVYRHLKKYN